jgi:hypothetical protein
VRCPAAGHLTRRRGSARGGVRVLCMSAPSTIIKPGPLLLAVEVDSRRTRLASRAATLLSSHARHPDRRRATQQERVRPTGRQPQRESARRRSGPSPGAGRHRRGANTTASLNTTARLHVVAHLVTPPLAHKPGGGALGVVARPSREEASLHRKTEIVTHGPVLERSPVIGEPDQVNVLDRERLVRGRDTRW